MSYLNKKSKVLFTGQGEKVIDNVIQFIHDQYDFDRCPPLETNLRWALKTEHPDVVIVCLMNETKDMMQAYDCLKSDTVETQIPVILIGDDESCFQFQSRLTIKGISVFKRPLDRVGLEKTLQQACEKAVARFPQMDLEEELIKANLASALLEQVAERKSVLVVDDDTRMLSVLKRYLQDTYDVTVVPSGKLAIKFISRRKVDIVLLDYLMPEMNGLEVLKQIREGTNNVEVPVIFLTGVADKGDVMKGLELLPNSYLLKPVTKEALLKRVEAVLQGL